MPGSLGTTILRSPHEGDAYANWAEQLDLCCRVMRGFNNLPLFPTRTWCFKAAQELARVMPDALLAVAVVENHVIRNLISVPVAGVTAGDARAKRWNGANVSKIEQKLTSGRWKTYTDTGARGARIIPAPQIDARSLPFEADDYEAGLLVCPAPTGASTKSRRLVLHAAFDRPHRTPLAVVQVVMEHLAELATAAFPDDLTYGNLVTDREEEVVSLLMRGLTVPEISRHLARSPHTIHDHIKKIHAKTGVSTRGELVARALGHIPPPTEPKPSVSRRKPGARQ